MSNVKSRCPYIGCDGKFNYRNKISLTHRTFASCPNYNKVQNSLNKIKEQTAKTPLKINFNDLKDNKINLEKQILDLDVALLHEKNKTSLVISLHEETKRQLLLVREELEKKDQELRVLKESGYKPNTADFNKQKKSSDILFNYTKEQIYQEAISVINTIYKEGNKHIDQVQLKLNKLKEEKSNAETNYLEKIFLLEEKIKNYDNISENSVKQYREDLLFHKNNIEELNKNVFYLQDIVNKYEKEKLDLNSQKASLKQNIDSNNFDLEKRSSKEKEQILKINELEYIINVLKSKEKKSHNYGKNGQSLDNYTKDQIYEEALKYIEDLNQKIFQLQEEIKIKNQNNPFKTEDQVRGVYRSKGSANGSLVFFGPRNGAYYINSRNNRSYIPKNNYINIDLFN